MTKMPTTKWDTQQRFEAIFFITAIALIVTGFTNDHIPLAIAGLAILVIIVLQRIFAKKIRDKPEIIYRDSKAAPADSHQTDAG